METLFLLYWISQNATSSYALQSLSSSYALTASFASNVPATASYALQALSASFALTASIARDLVIRARNGNKKPHLVSGVNVIQQLLNIEHILQPLRQSSLCRI